MALSGSSENYKVNNIYDMSGNVHDWTQEASSAIYRVAREGFQWGGPWDPVSSRSYAFPDYSDAGFGSRLQLYIK